MATHLVKARHQQKIDSTANWYALDALILRDGEIGIERKDMGGETAYLMKVGDGASAYAELPYLQAVAADVYAWAKQVNLIEGTLATYTLDEGRIGRINASDTLQDALNKIENALASAVEGNGEKNLPAFSAIRIGDETLRADSVSDTIELLAGENVSLEMDAEARAIVVSAEHPKVDAEAASQETAQPGFGEGFSVVGEVVRDEHGHIIGLTQRQVTLPDLPAIQDTITRIGVTGDAEAVTVDGTPAAGDLLLGNAAGRTVAEEIPQAPSGAQNNQLPTLEAVKAYADGLLGANDAMVFKGTLGEGGTVTELPARHEVGWTYRVIAAGSYAGHACEVGDLLVCVTKGAAANDAHWTVAQTNLDGAVVAGDALRNHGLVVGKGGNQVESIAAGAFGQVLKAGEQGPVWENEIDTRVSDVADDSGQVFTGIASGVAVSRTRVAELTLTGFMPSGQADGALAATDTLGVALNKLGEAIAEKAIISNEVAAKTPGLYTIAHNAQGLITASEEVTAISADMLIDGVDTLIFYGGTSTDVV